MEFKGNEGHVQAVYNDMLKAAMKTNTDHIPGRALGKKPRFFLIGDEPNMKDYLTGVPFSGTYNDILINAVLTIEKRWPGASIADCYTTYLVKTTFRKEQFTEDDIWKHWIPVAQMEYKMSGCEFILGIGKVARMFTGHIATEPAIFQNYKPTVVDRIKKAWGVLNG